MRKLKNLDVLGKTRLIPGVGHVTFGEDVPEHVAAACEAAGLDWFEQDTGKLVNGELVNGELVTGDAVNVSDDTNIGGEDSNNGGDAGNVSGDINIGKEVTSNGKKKRK